MKLLITGGPIYGKLDDVKMVTNRFRGGMICDLVHNILESRPNWEITYLTTPGAKIPAGCKVILCDGFYDYEQKVYELTPTVDAVILGAAVANLIPKEPFPGKFPSHNYQPGDIINIPFVIAPRVILKIHELNPKANLFGFKLLSGVSEQTLVDVAYELCLESHATAIFANDNQNLEKKIAVTKEKSVIPMDLFHMAEFIIPAVEDDYYSTKISTMVETSFTAIEKFKKLVAFHESEFIKEKDMFFGSVAVRTGAESFITTTRGKNNLSDFCHVYHVNDKERIIYSTGKATLNAPLLARIFRTNQNVDSILHFHSENEDGYVEQEYAFPGTVRDTMRNISQNFFVKYHGTYSFYDKYGNRIESMD